MNEIINEILNKLGLTYSIAIFGTAFLFIIYFAFKELKQTYYGYGVPFVPSSDYKVERLSEIIKLEKGQRFLDLGCGDGKILEAIKKSNPENEVYGIENSPNPYKLAIKRRIENKLDYTIIKNNFFKEDFSKYDVIFSFMIHYLMIRIWTKIKSECKPGTLFYSNVFEIKGEKYYDKIEIKKGKYKSNMYVYKV